jgi:cytochrome P450
MTLFLAGHETTAIALSWAWYLLSQHPEAEGKLLAELRSVLGGRAPTVDDLPRLGYAERVVTEAMRLYPPAWTLGRESLEAFELDGYRVPGGTIAVMSQWVLHRDPRFFERPDEFDPDRWADGLARRLPKFAYFPFGGGPRQCIGNAFATMEAVLLLATIAQQFQLSLLPGHPVVPWPSATLRPRNGLKMTLHRR